MIGLLGAMDEEVAATTELLANAESVVLGGSRFVTGEVAGRAVVLAISGFGKVAAASTATTMLDAFSPSAVLFTGVAGGVGDGVAIGDLVVADELCQHDFDASPIFPRFVIPSLGRARLPATPHVVAALTKACRSTGRATHVGLIASGDRFVDDPTETAALRRDLPDLLAVEMEGGAVAQVCAERSTPFGVVRAISDRADADAPVDFLDFVATVAPTLSAIVAAAIEQL